jgi:MSHA pilin protein MshC
MGALLFMPSQKNDGYRKMTTGYELRATGYRRRQTLSCPACRLRPVARRRSHTARTRGYTIVELVVVIVILGVIAAIAGPKFFGTRVFSERGYADEVASSLRYAQKIAVASGCNVRFAITLAGYNAMQQAPSGNRCDAASGVWSTAVKRPDGSPLAGTPPSDANVAAAATMTFDAKGAIVSGATNLSVGAYTLTVNAASGFVVVQ